MKTVENMKRKILIVDDEPQIRKNIRILLEKKTDVTILEASNGEEALSIYHKESPEVMILDYNMPGLSGRELLSKIREDDQFVQIMFLTARTEETVIADILNAGANDYLKKPYNKTEILARVNNCLRIYNLTEKLNLAIKTDDLTGLRNMRLIYEEIDEILERSYESGHSSAIAMIDMDYFKTVNDGHDHLFGSFVLKEVGQVISEIIQDHGFAARFGGDEFMLIFPETTYDNAVTICNTLKKRISGYLFQKNDDEMNLTCSIGLAVMDPAAERVNSQAIVRVADEALYYSKEHGRNQVTAHSQSDDSIIFKNAIKKGKINKHHELA